MFVRRFIVIVIALLVAAQVVRNSAVQAMAGSDPQSAARVWSAHPAVEISLGLAEIGRAAREGTIVAPATFSMINDAATKAPLASEPFLVRGVRAQMVGDDESARRAFLEAQWRNPRSLPAAYFLASDYLRHGQSLKGLVQTAVLGKLSPGGTGIVAPFLAAYAQNTANWREIRSLFRSQPELEDGVLASLAADGRNADAILAVADSAHRKADSAWLQVLLAKLVAGGDYIKARAIWSSVARADAGHDLLFDTQFSKPSPPPPFNWSLTSSSSGLAERQPGGALHVLFYGNEDGVLASQLVLLPAGTYRLQMEVADLSHADTLHWSLRCDKGSDPISGLPLDGAAKRGWTFQIPANCPAQWLELSGRSADVTQQAEATIAGLTLKRIAAHA